MPKNIAEHVVAVLCAALHCEDTATMSHSHVLE